MVETMFQGCCDGNGILKASDEHALPDLTSGASKHL